MNYYPAFLNLEGKKTVVVGGGRIAERKVLKLMQAGADVIVVSPELTSRLRRERDAGRLRHIPRAYRPGDLKDSFLVIVATDSPEVNKRAAGDAPSLLNVVDVPSECNFIAPSTVKRGSLVLAVSTGGTSPALAKAIRKEIEKLYGPAFSGYLGFVKALRARAMKEVPDKKAREKFLKDLASENTVHDLRKKGLKTVKQSVLNRFQELTSKNK